MNNIVNKNLSEVIHFINFHHHNKPIIFVGMMGAGKSAIGRILAKSLDRVFCDIDQNIENHYNMKIYEIFEIYGEEKFRDIEHEEIKRINSRSNNVIATGGGAFTFQRNLNILNNLGLTVWLNTNKDTIIERLKKNINNRPLLKNVDIEKHVDDLLLKRNPLYSKAKLNIISKNNSKTEMRNKILLKIKKYLVENKNVKSN
ncbi:MAG: shikimate kinase [Pelagibacterales bacterium]|nr:shikimate kinase [Pelagibacterales bacterium]PPR17224.1 MAG: Shikimate kinase [Alphaproteobacteria bacterium MarineAlpha9_Bin3]|tara:strand:+ start:4320 stop:4922 length:603 start_codon:yes stop_codon:yes gene_type:complete